MHLIVLCMLLLSTIFGTIIANLEECVLVTDPHITTFHPLNQAPTSRHRKDCLGNMNLNPVLNSFAAININVHQHWMVELTFIFRSPPSPTSVCIISSWNFTISSLPTSCASSGIFHNVTDDGRILTLNIYYPRAQMVVVVTHQRYVSIRHYNMHIWMPSNITANDQGACTRVGCVGSGIGKRSVQNYVNNATNLSNHTAALVCDATIQAYLSSLLRVPSQRNAHYNATIQHAYEACIFDVGVAGAGVASGILEMLMIEELTNNATNLTNVFIAVERNISQASARLSDVVNNTLPQIVGILNNTNQNVPGNGSVTLTPTTILHNNTTVNSNPGTSTSTAQRNLSANLLCLNLIGSLPLILYNLMYSVS